MKASINRFETNVNNGGHVWRHIYGLQSKPYGAIGSQYGVSMLKLQLISHMHGRICMDSPNAIMDVQIKIAWMQEHCRFIALTSAQVLAMVSVIMSTHLSQVKLYSGTTRLTIDGGY